MSDKISIFKCEFIEHSNEISKLCSTLANFLDTSIVTNTQTIV